MMLRLPCALALLEGQEEAGENQSIASRIRSEGESKNTQKNETVFVRGNGMAREKVSAYTSTTAVPTAVPPGSNYSQAWTYTADMFYIHRTTSKNAAV